MSSNSLCFEEGEEGLMQKSRRVRDLREQSGTIRQLSRPTKVDDCEFKALYL